VRHLVGLESRLTQSPTLSARKPDVQLKSAARLFVAKSCNGARKTSPKSCRQLFQGGQPVIQEVVKNLPILLFFSPTDTKLQASTIVLSKVWLQRRLIGSQKCWGRRPHFPFGSLEGYWQLLKSKGAFSIGSPVINVACLPISWTSSTAQSFQVPPVYFSFMPPLSSFTCIHKKHNASIYRQMRKTPKTHKNHSICKERKNSIWK